MESNCGSGMAQGKSVSSPTGSAQSNQLDRRQALTPIDTSGQIAYKDWRPACVQEERRYRR
jgi:hypothetical protein